MEKPDSTRYIFHMGLRKNVRYNASGQVYIAEITDTGAMLKNLSAGGLCIKSSGFMNIAPNTKLTVDIVPEEDSSVQPFTVDIEAKWIRSQKGQSESGFIIIVPPGTQAETLLRQYVEFLAERSQEAS
jgi:hypothetical protein